MSYEIFRFSEYEVLSLDFITSVIANTQKYKAEIITGWEKLVAFALKNPCLELKDEFGYYINGNLEKLNIKDEYIIDSYEKIISQTKIKTNNYDTNLETISMFYYGYEIDKKNEWLQEQIQVGELDSEGILNYGSCVILRSFSINWKLFLQLYSQKFN